MDKVIGTAVVLVLVLATVLLMLRSWRARRARDARLSAYPVPHPGEPGGAGFHDAGYSGAVYYVATTPRAQPAERLAIPGLTHRAKAAMVVEATGVTLTIPGENPSFIPAQHIDGVGAATWAIDRGVETGGLIVIAWRVRAADGGGMDVDSYFRPADRDDHDRIITAVNTVSAGGSGTRGSEVQ